MGSSPRVRGKPTISSSGRSKTGLIPACAGKTQGSFLRRSLRAAHPRVCGENLIVSRANAIGPGSSPRVRGKQTTLCASSGTCGLIPACAGKTWIDVAHAIQIPAHPRVCGENARSPQPPSKPPGSSPRVRGKRSSLIQAEGVRRLIPACAGKTNRRAESH